jgi:energy-coupling factor transporter ATP-binding protein EcfA2
MATSILLEGPQGCGKSLLGQLIAGAYPPDQTLECDMESVLSKFNKNLQGKVFIQCDELLVGDKRKIADKIKHLITRDKVIIEPKGVDSYSVRDLANYLFTTNQPDAADLESEDRRLIVLEVGKGKPLDQTLADRIGQWRRTQVGRDTMRFFLKRYPLNTIIFDGEDAHRSYFRRHSFSPTAGAPMTQAKTAMIEDSRSILEQHAHDLIEETRPDDDGKPRTEPSHHDLITLQKAAERMGVNLEKVSEKAWAMALRRHGAIRLERIRFGARRLYIWALHHTDEWSKASAREIADAIGQPAVSSSLGQGERY